MINIYFLFSFVLSIGFASVLKANDISDTNFKVYSMIFSAKYNNYNHLQEKNIFFFPIPATFATQMKVGSNNTLLFNFTNASSFREILNVVEEQGKIAENSTFSELLEFSNDYKQLNVSLDFVSHTSFKLQSVNEFQNAFAKSFQVRIIDHVSDSAQSFYVTINMAKSENTESELTAISDFLNSIKGNYTNNESLKFLE
jgi:hypothetical protein